MVQVDFRELSRRGRFTDLVVLVPFQLGKGPLVVKLVTTVCCGLIWISAAPLKLKGQSIKQF